MPAWDTGGHRQGPHAEEGRMPTRTQISTVISQGAKCNEQNKPVMGVRATGEGQAGGGCAPTGPQRNRGTFAAGANGVGTCQCVSEGPFVYLYLWCVCVCVVYADRCVQICDSVWHESCITCVDTWCVYFAYMCTRVIHVCGGTCVHAQVYACLSGHAGEQVQPQQSLPSTLRCA